MSKTLMKKTAKKILNRWLRKFVSKMRTFPTRSVFLLGHDRSGSSWIGSMLGQAANTIYLHEPINEEASNIGNWHLYNSYLKADESSDTHRRIFDLATRGIGVRDLSLQECGSLLIGQPTVIIKETGGMLLGEWLQHNYRAAIVALFRHPVPVILSNVRMSQRNGGKWLSQLLRQEKIAYMRGIQKGVELVKPSTVLEEFASVYAIRYKILFDQVRNNPEWIFALYEDFCTDPMTEFEQLFKKLGLKMTNKTQKKIWQASSVDGSSEFFGIERLSKNQPFAWKKSVTKDMVNTLRSTLAAFDFPLYKEEKWW
jgi:hypothetical protein